MINVLITGAGSYVGERVKQYILSTSSDFCIDTVDTISNKWIMTDFSKYDAVFHVAGIAHVNAKKKMKSLYYKVNRDLAIEVARHAKDSGVKHFIFMSSMIVFHESKSLKNEIITSNTSPKPNGFYGDSKLQAEVGLQKMDCEEFRVCILRPPMIYGPGSKGNFPKLIKLATITPIFPAFHNQRSMLYIDNLAEFVKQALIYKLRGIFYPQNKELSDTVEIIRFFAHNNGHKIAIWRILNPFVVIGSKFFQSINKMFSTYYYDKDMSKMDFEYQIVSLEESLNEVANYISNTHNYN